jgi:acyl carrier protein
VDGLRRSRNSVWSDRGARDPDGVRYTDARDGRAVGAMNQTSLHTRVKQLIIDRLQLEGMTPTDIDDAAPLFGDGLGLDSIDALELVIGIEKAFGVRIQDEDVGAKAFASVNSLVEFMRSRGVNENA